MIPPALLTTTVFLTRRLDDIAVIIRVFDDETPSQCKTWEGISRPTDVRWRRRTHRFIVTTKLHSFERNIPMHEKVTASNQNSRLVVRPSSPATHTESVLVARRNTGDAVFH